MNGSVLDKRRQRLDDRAHVPHASEGRAYRYRPLVQPSEAGGTALRNLFVKAVPNGTFTLVRESGSSGLAEQRRAFVIGNVREAAVFYREAAALHLRARRPLQALAALDLAEAARKKPAPAPRQGEVLSVRRTRPPRTGTKPLRCSH